MSFILFQSIGEQQQYDVYEKMHLKWSCGKSRGTLFSRLAIPKEGTSALECRWHSMTTLRPYSTLYKSFALMYPANNGEELCEFARRDLMFALYQFIFPQDGLGKREWGTSV